MNKEKLISVIVPCYNVEKYVEKSIGSILNQTYKNIEIIAIDDCSTDNTYESLKKIEKENNNLKVFKNDKNMGLAATRNFGIKNVKGEYIGFIDPDDLIDLNFYEELFNKLSEDAADVAICNMILTDEEYKPISGELCCCEGDISKKNIINNGLAASACNKLFKTDLLIKYPFLDGKINEDVAAIIPIIVNCNKITYTNKVKYYYLQRNTSIQNSKFNKKRFEMFDAIDVCLDRIKDDKEFEEYKTIILYQQLLLLYIYVITEQSGFINRYKLIKEFIKRQEKFRVYQNKLFYPFYMYQRKTLKVYYYVLVKLMKFKAAFAINTIIAVKQFLRDLKKYISKTFRKQINFIKEIMGKKVIPSNLNMKDLIKKAKYQNRLKSENIKVSVVIPNYNYENFLYERIYSILNQNVKIHEVIILDDCSKDNSIELIDKIVENLKEYIDISKIYNEENSGSAFKQWAKGFKIAKGDYVWIAEADDYCDKNILENLLNPIKNNDNIYISYVDTAFVDKVGNIFVKSIKSEIDLMNTGHWDSDFISKGLDEVKKYAFLNCTIANVSSCIIKKDNYDDIFDKIGDYRQAGDWLFYANVMARGSIAYTNKVMNYYRVHGENITSQMKKQKHLDEIKKIHSELSSTFGTNDFQEDKRKERYDFLTKVWNLD